MRYKVEIAYDGRNYVGFQSQINGRAIQDTIEDVIKIIFGVRLRIIFSSRTDAGVHAKAQVFHFDVDREIAPYKVKTSFNALLPKDMHVNKVEIVDESFHARFSVKEKTYEYLINLGEKSPFLIGYAYQCYFKLDIEIMKKGADLLVGKHEFGSFNTTPYSEKADQHRTISEFSLNQQGDLLIIRVTGDGFLRNMVRIMVGTLIDLGRGKKNLEDIQKMLDVSNKSTRRYNIDPNGLYLVNIRY